MSFFIKSIEKLKNFKEFTHMEKNSAARSRHTQHVHTSSRFTNPNTGGLGGAERGEYDSKKIVASVLNGK